MAANGGKIAGNWDFGQDGSAGSGGETGGLREAGCGEGGGVGESGSWGGNRERGEADRDSWMAERRWEQDDGGGGVGLWRHNQPERRRQRRLWR